MKALVEQLTIGMGERGKMQQIIQELLSSSSPNYCKTSINSLKALLLDPNIFRTLTYCDGIIGIGCGILILYNAGILDKDFRNLILEIDQVVMRVIDKRLFSDLSLNTGVCGAGYYLYLRVRDIDLQTSEDIEDLTIAQYIIYFIDWLYDVIISPKQHQDTFYDIFFLTKRLFSIGILKNELHQILNIISADQTGENVNIIANSYDPYPF